MDAQSKFGVCFVYGLLFCSVSVCSTAIIRNGCQLPEVTNATIYRASDGEALNPKEPVPNDEEIRVRCDIGFEWVSGEKDKSTKCERGKWIEELPEKCEAKKCLLSKVTDATCLKKRTKTGDALSVSNGTIIHLSCRSGYEAQNNVTESLCIYGEWNEALICDPKKCFLSSMTNATRLEMRTKTGASLNGKTVVSHRTIIRLSCKSDYEAQNKVKKSICIYGEWSKTLVCKPTNCIIPEVSNASIYERRMMGQVYAGDQVPTGRNILIACKNNYVINKSPYTGTLITRRCTKGIWTKQMPDQCLIPDDCEFIPPEHAEVHVKYTVENNSRKSEIEVKCNTGFEIVHSNISLPIFQTKCSNGALAPTLPVCERIKGHQNITCKLPSRRIYNIGVGRKAKAKDRRYVKHKARIDMACKKGFNAPVRMQCLDGTFEPSIPACEDNKNKHCQLPNYYKYTFNGPEAGEWIQHGESLPVVCTSGQLDFYAYYTDYYYNTEEANMSVLCHNGILYGLDKMKCDGGRSLKCTELIENGSLKHTFGKTMVECDKGYTLSISQRLNDFTCDEHGNLENQAKINQHAVCLPNNCILPKILNIQVESLTNDGKLPYLSGGMRVIHLEKILLNCTAVGYEPSNRIVQCMAGEWVDEEDHWDITPGTFKKCRKAKCEPKCENFGKCIRNNECQCPIERTGDICTEFNCPVCKENGGSCPVSLECVCPQDQFGENCEHFNCPLCKENGGTCPNSVQCVCPQDKIGENCEQFNCPMCKENGGTCPISPRCVCPQDKIGENCEHFNCSAACKENGGTCPTSTTCVCPQDRIGENCEHFNCPVCKQNGGTCPTSLKCVCPKGRVGENCEHFGCLPPYTTVVVKNNKLMYNIGDEVEFACESDKLSEGDMKSVCLESGDWAGDPSCLDKNITYRVRFTTNDASDTNGTVFLKMHGETGQQTEEIELTGALNKGRNNLNVYLSNIGNISHINVRLERRPGIGFYWDLERITIHDPARRIFYFFPCGQRISDDNIPHTFTPNGGLEACEQWYSEISKNDFSSEPRTLGSGRFTQMIWKASTEMGIGKAKTLTGKCLVVANYRPAGNFVGKFVENVPPLKK